MNFTFTLLSAICLALGGLYAVVTLVNLAVFRAPRRGAAAGVPVSVLIPAREEAANIAAALDCVAAQTEARIEVIVCDDGSTDGTDRIVAARAAADPRIRLIRGAPLPPGWNGKQHACHQLAAAARHPRLLFLDADVRLAPDAVARMSAYMDENDLGLVSGFPRQITRSLAEMVAIPQILVVLLGYLPFPMARMLPGTGFAAGCGQLMLVEAEAYARAGGHAAFRDRMHDGLNLPRNIRASGGRTDILDATPLAHVRMYDNWPDIRDGFTKNATEGMAKPVALPVWTLLLAGGHLLPPVVALVAWAAGQAEAAAIAGIATAAVFLARTALALKVRQHPLSVLLHPAGVVVMLWIQWSALLGRRRGAQATWRGRSYEMN
ncbi:glycosyltransferase family 2 protein [Jannaschia formosa]|uniref:glycosyltransferase family 2 protein n=1 Tax=Jannaschia formosa TaxID=2259592 RepID=UPI000E1BB3D7|nr:glycosyltransferase family 2 protein [Jannaschia formosa]TFL16297.1 glycosyltransferase [Jannaschia formosa]